MALYSLEPVEPGVAQLLAAAADALLEVVVDAVGDQELGVLGPAVELLGEPDLVLAQGLAVGAVGVLLVGSAPGDVAVDDDQGRPVVRARGTSGRPARAAPGRWRRSTRVTFQP